VADGGMAIWNNGLISPTRPDDRLGMMVAFILTQVWILATFVAFYGFVAQFIYRYLTLNRQKPLTD
jgi:hypothetical protein